MMNQKISQQNWSSVKGEIQKSFSNLSADDLEQTQGDASRLTDLVTDKAGIQRADAEKRLDEIVARCGTQASSFDEDENEDFKGYADGDLESDLDDERFGADEGLTSPRTRQASSEPVGTGSQVLADRSAERTPRQDFVTPASSKENSSRSFDQTPQTESTEDFSSDSARKTDRSV